MVLKREISTSPPKQNFFSYLTSIALISIFIGFCCYEFNRNPEGKEIAMQIKNLFMTKGMVFGKFLLLIGFIINMGYLLSVHFNYLKWYKVLIEMDVKKRFIESEFSKLHTDFMILRQCVDVVDDSMEGREIYRYVFEKNDMNEIAERYKENIRKILFNSEDPPIVKESPKVLWTRKSIKIQKTNKTKSRKPNIEKHRSSTRMRIVEEHSELDDHLLSETDSESEQENIKVYKKKLDRNFDDTDGSDDEEFQVFNENETINELNYGDNLTESELEYTFTKNIERKLIPIKKQSTVTIEDVSESEPDCLGNSQFYGDSDDCRIVPLSGKNKRNVKIDSDDNEYEASDKEDEDDSDFDEEQINDDHNYYETSEMATEDIECSVMDVMSVGIEDSVIDDNGTEVIDYDYDNEYEESDDDRNVGYDDEQEDDSG